jgi:hypothetical protein
MMAAYLPDTANPTTAISDVTARRAPRCRLGIARSSILYVIGGPRVRIHLPPAASLEQTGSALFLSLQMDDEAELAEVYDRLARAGQRIVEAKAATCCYANPTSSGSPTRRACRGRPSSPMAKARSMGEGSLEKLREVSGCVSGCEPPPAELMPKPAAEACCAPSDPRVNFAISVRAGRPPGPRCAHALKAVVHCPKPGHWTLRLFQRCRW